MIEWCPFATHRDGPAWKTGYGWVTTNQLKGIVDHSAEGPLEAAMSVLDGTRTASWHFTVDDQIYQHYGLSEVTWHCGGLDGNSRFVGIEHTGKAGEPLTDAQYENTRRLHKWIFEQTGWGLPVRRDNLWEHREIAATYGYGATACPSGRIPWDRLVADLTPKVDWVGFRLAAAHVLTGPDDKKALDDTYAWFKWLYGE